jgi:hypothetical protein
MDGIMKRGGKHDRQKEKHSNNRNSASSSKVVFYECVGL